MSAPINAPNAAWRELDLERQCRFDDPHALLAFLLEPPVAAAEVQRNSPCER